MNPNALQIEIDESVRDASSPGSQAEAIRASYDGGDGTGRSLAVIAPVVSATILIVAGVVLGRVRRPVLSRFEA